LPISYNTFVSQMQTVAGQDAPSINVSRALTRLKSVFITLTKDAVNTYTTTLRVIRRLGEIEDQRIMNE